MPSWLWRGLALTLLVCAHAHARHHPTRRHGPPPVIIIAADGLSARATESSPGFTSLLRVSQYTLRARTTEHTRSIEGWESALAGTFDADVPFHPTLHPPLFTHVRAQRHYAQLLVFSEWGRLFDIVNKTAADYWDTPVGSVAVANRFLEYTTRNGLPSLSVLYMMDCDRTGHTIGWDTAAYTTAVETLAGEVHRLRDRFPWAVFFVVSDHGGYDTGHWYGSHDMYNPHTDIDSATYRDVPWMMFGHGVSPMPLCHTMRNDDTVEQVMRAMEMQLHPSWRRRGALVDTVPPCTHAQVAARETLADNAAAVRLRDANLAVGMIVMLHLATH